MAAKKAKKLSKKPSAKPKASKAKPVAKKAVKKPVAKKAVKKLAVKKPAKKAPAPKQRSALSINSKPIIRTGPSIQPRSSIGRAPLSAMKTVAVTLKAEKAKPLTKKELEFHRDLLYKLRDRVIDEISFLANDNLNKSSKDASGDLSSYSFHMADQGTDNFDREFAASLLNSEHDVLYEIEEALRRIDQGTYGVCEMSGQPIERERLKALPFARFCVAVQSEMERGKPKFRPFRRTSIQGAETAV